MIELVRFNSDVNHPGTARLLNFLFEQFRVPSQQRRLWRAGLSAPGTHFYGLPEMSDETFDAAAVLTEVGLPEAELRLLAVRPYLRGHGIGRAVLGLLEQKAVLHGTASMRVRPAGNPPGLHDPAGPAWRFYERAGYVPHTDPAFNGYLVKDPLPPQIS